MTGPSAVETYRRGFTLLELLVVIAIIGILSAIVLANIRTAVNKANAARDISTAKSFADAMYASCVIDQNAQGLPTLTINDFQPGATICGVSINTDSTNQFSLVSSGSGQVMFSYGSGGTFATCAIKDPNFVGQGSGASIVTVCPYIDYPTACITTPKDGVACTVFTGS